MPAQTGEAGDGEGVPQGLSWSWEMDFGALIASLTGAGSPDAAPASDAAGDAAGRPGGAASAVDEEAVQ